MSTESPDDHRAATGAGAVSDRAVLRKARMLRTTCLGLEALLYLIVAGSVVAFGAVHPWAYVPVWAACLLAGLLLIVRSAIVASLRKVLGRRRFSLHLSRRWLVLDPGDSYADEGWAFDLRKPFVPHPPLLLPGLAFILWIGAQLGYFFTGGRSLTVSIPDTRRGLAFVVSLLLLHLVAAVVLERREVRERFRHFVGGLGFLLALEALIQLATGTERIYGFFTPLEHGAIFGPFVNRNHFAGYMLMVAFTTFGLLGRAWVRYRRRAGQSPNVRRRLVALSTEEGTRLVYAVVPAVAIVGALIATTSRGGIIAFVAGLVLAGLGLRFRSVPAWGLAVAFVVMALSWFGLERLGIRFNETAAQAPGRTEVWKDSLSRMRGHWLTGTGFNTFGLSMSHTTPWTIPKGATPWPPEIEAAVSMGKRPGTRALSTLANLNWYREAHNDYVQVLVEAGIPGLLIALWAATAALLATRGDPWLLAAVASVLMHVFVDFDLQIPAIPVLLVSLVAMRVEKSRS